MHAEYAEESSNKLRPIWCTANSQQADVKRCFGTLLLISFVLEYAIKKIAEN